MNMYCNSNSILDCPNTSHSRMLSIEGGGQKVLPARVIITFPLLILQAPFNTFTTSMASKQAGGNFKMNGSDFSAAAGAVYLY